MQTLECHAPRVLFVNGSQHETDFMTRDLPMAVVRTDRLSDLDQEMASEQLRAIFVDVAAAEPADIVTLKKKNASRHGIPLFILTDPEELPLAIKYVKLGAQGFLVKGVSDSDSVLKLMQYATSQH